MTSQKKMRRTQRQGIRASDLFYAVIFHIMIFASITALVVWQKKPVDEPLKRIQVMMISAQELAKIEQQSRRKAKPVKAPKKTEPTTKKTVKAAKSEPQKHAKKPAAKAAAPKQQKTALKPPKSAVKKIAAKAVPKTTPKAHQSKPAVKPAHKVDPDFDPFAPITSTSDRTETTKKATTSRPEMANLMGQQLSKNEIERYIALMQAKIEENWKIPANITNTSDPLVEMELTADGHVVTIRILESSGNALLDNSLIRAIKAAAPFDLPHQQFEFFRVNQLRFHPLK